MWTIVCHVDYTYMSSPELQSHAMWLASVLLKVGLATLARPRPWKNLIGGSSMSDSITRFRLTHRDTHGDVIYCNQCGCPLMSGDNCYAYDDIGAYCSRSCASEGYAFETRRDVLEGGVA